MLDLEIEVYILQSSPSGNLLKLHKQAFNMFHRFNRQYP